MRDTGCFAVMSRARDVHTDCATLFNIATAVGSWGSDAMPMSTVESAVTTRIVRKAACERASEAWVVKESWAGAVSDECQKILDMASDLVNDAAGRTMRLRAATVSKLLADFGAEGRRLLRWPLVEL